MRLWECWCMTFNPKASCACWQFWKSIPSGHNPFSTKYKLLQWERRPKVVELLHSKQSMSWAVCSCLCNGVFMDVLAATETLSTRCTHPSPGVFYHMQMQGRRPIHATGLRGHTNTHTSSLFLLLSWSQNRIPVWSDTRVDFRSVVCLGTVTQCESAMTHRAMQSNDRELQGHCVWIELYLIPVRDSGSNCSLSRPL